MNRFRSNRRAVFQAIDGERHLLGIGCSGYPSPHAAIARPGPDLTCSSVRRGGLVLDRSLFQAADGAGPVVPLVSMAGRRRRKASGFGAVRKLDAHGCHHAREDEPHPLRAFGPAAAHRPARIYPS